MANMTPDPPPNALDRVLNGSHNCDVDGEHRNDLCWDKTCVCSMCGSFWHWNIWHWERAHGRAV